MQKPENKYVIVGIKEYIYNETDDGLGIRESREFLCFVDSVKEGKDFIKQQVSLKLGKDYYPSWRNRGPYKSKSILFGYHRAEVEENPLLNLENLKDFEN